MVKRILSIVVSAVMLVSCFVFVASAEDTRYEGIKYFQSMEDMLKELNDDSADSNNAMWDYEDRVAQQNVLNASTVAFDTDFTGVDKWADYCGRVLTRDSDGIGSREGNVINYLKMLDIFKTDDASLTAAQLDVKEEFSDKHLAPEYDVEGLGLRDSLAKLDDYTYQIGVTISHHRATLDAYALSDEKKTEYMLHGTKALYQIFFRANDTDMRNAFDTGFLGDDEGKKLIAVMYGKALTTELATDNIMTVLIGYVNNNFVTVKNEFGELVKKNYGEDTEKAIFDFFKSTIVKAYNASSVTDETKADIKMLFGNPEVADDKGAFQIMFETMDSSKADSYGMLNIWFNLFLRQHTQLSVAGNKATTLKAGVEENENRITVRNGNSAALNVENLDRYGIDVNAEFLSLGSDWLDLKVYNEDGTENADVTYSKENGKIYVSYNSEKANRYPGYIQLVRNDGTYIETYPVEIVNVKSTIRPPSTPGGGGVTVVEPEYTLSFDTGGGSDISSENYDKNEVVIVNKVPVKEGYVFEGWYLDKECTISAESVTITKDIVLYAKWVEDNGIAGGNYPTPDGLNGEDHFAYVIGYPDGTVRPQNNITRAEVAAIFFRLLKEDVREENLASANVFTDVSDGEWYNMAVSTLEKLGIIEGRTLTEFVPNDYITRAEFATICARFDDTDYVITDNFSDISGHWAEGYIREAAGRGWIKGYEDETFRPDRLITRAETMTLINRILNRNPENEDDLHEDMIEWADNNPNDWYYLPVQEATNSHVYTKKNNVYEAWTEMQSGTDWTQYQK